MWSILAGKFPPDVRFVVNGKEHCLPYFLVDRIYLNWCIFVKTITDGDTEEKGLFAAAQEAVSKNVKRGFRVLVARIHILSRGCQMWYR